MSAVLAAYRYTANMADAPQSRIALNAATQLQPELVRLRRELHANPELGFQEKQTAAVLQREFSELGCQLRTGMAKTGIAADLGPGTPVIAIRAEMDAVPIGELNRVPYCSKVPGISHACGHDANMACVVGAAKLLARHEDQLACRFIIQPAAEPVTDESGKTGASLMIEQGALQNVRAIISVHVDATIQTGQVGVLAEPQQDLSTRFKLVLKKKAANAEENLIYVAISLIEGLNSSHPDSPISISSVNSAPCHWNQTPESVTIAGCFRAKSRETREALKKQIQQCSMAMNDCATCELEFNQGDSLPHYSAEVSQALLEASGEVLGSENVLSVKRKTWLEDFAPYTEVVPGALLLLGSQIKYDKRTHHSATFDINEDCLSIGAAILMETVQRLLRSADRLAITNP
jgi:amidohydrolase